MKKIVVASSLLLLTACSSIIEGTSQEILVNTNPPGASCDFVRQENVIANIPSTPGGVTVKKTKYDIKILCKKEGYIDAVYLNHSGSAGATFGNIVAGGLIGWGIDSASGADNKYDSPVNLSFAMSPAVVSESSAGVKSGKQVISKK